MLAFADGRDVLSDSEEPPSPPAGAFCYSAQSCAARSLNSTTSKGLPAAPGPLDGLLCPAAEVNPNYYKSASVLLPSCTSDLWAGLGGTLPGFGVFTGASTLAAVVSFLGAGGLPGGASLKDADRVFLIGGPGVLARLDDVAAAVRAAGAPRLKAVLGVCDGACLLPSLPPVDSSPPPCSRDGDCPYEVGLPGLQSIAGGLARPSWCDSADVWRCYEGSAVVGALRAGRTPALLLLSAYDATVSAAYSAWPPAAPGTPAAAWAERVLAPWARAATATAAGGPGALAVVVGAAAACGGPPRPALTNALFRTLVRHVDVYGRVHIDTLAAAVSIFAEATAFANASDFGAWGDAPCGDGAPCNPACAQWGEPS